VNAHVSFATDQRKRGLLEMKTFKPARALAAALIGVAVAGPATIARADIKDYEFQLIDSTIRKGDAIISVRLVHTPDGKPVPDAVIFASRLDMATRIVSVPSTEPGVYRFKAAVSMQGRWQLSLGAKVQGEAGTLESKLVVTAQP
jgi:hypothetical protein